MRVLIAPDGFRGTLSAHQAAEAIALGWRRESPRDDLTLMPMSDGGPGFIDAVAAAVPGRTIPLTVTGPRGESVPAAFHIDLAGTAYIESAQACGIHLIPQADRDPRLTTTRGVGELIAAAIDAGAGRVVVGLGGSGTCDGGAGLLGAVGATAVDGRGVTIPLDAGAQALRGVAAASVPDLGEIELVAASDVDVPLCGPRGAAHGFAAQKFPDPDAVEAATLTDLDDILRGFALAVGRTRDGRDPAVALGAGAAGGLGFAIMALGGCRVPGIETVATTVGLADAVVAADLVITGEGRFDWQSLRGKVVSGVAAAALAQARPAVLLAGQVQVGRREWIGMGISAAYALADGPGGVPGALADPAGVLAATAQRAARQWAR